MAYIAYGTQHSISPGLLRQGVLEKFNFRHDPLTVVAIVSAALCMPAILVCHFCCCGRRWRVPVDVGVEWMVNTTLWLLGTWPLLLDFWMQHAVHSKLVWSDTLLKRYLSMSAPFFAALLALGLHVGILHSRRGCSRVPIAMMWIITVALHLFFFYTLWFPSLELVQSVRLQSAHLPEIFLGARTGHRLTMDENQTITVAFSMPLLC